MKFFNCLFLSVVFCSSPFTVLGQQNSNDESYLTYSIPDNAIKLEPKGTRGRDAISITYIDPVTNKKTAEEFFDIKTKKKIKLVLYKNGKKHGIQKTWYKDGSPKTEAPYKNDIIHGEFKHWDEKGNLVGFYKMSNGNGVKRIFFSNGKLKEKKDFKNNVLSGESFIFFDNGQGKSLNWKTKGSYYRDSFSFHKNGELYCYGTFDAKAKLNGTVVYFNKKGLHLEKELVYYIHGRKITKEEYLKASEKDSSLPKLEEDLEKYKEYAYEQTKDIVKKYKNMEPIQIPLEKPTPNE